MNRLLCTALMLVGVPGCADTDPIRPSLRGPITQIVRVSGDSQIGQVHSSLPGLITVKVLDDQSVALPGVRLRWRSAKGGGASFFQETVTDATGAASNTWFLGDTAGTQELLAEALDSAGTPVVVARLVATALPGPVAAQGFTVRRLVVFADSQITLPAFARDAYGNPLPFQIQLVDTAAVPDIAGRWRPMTAVPVRMTLGSDSLTAHVVPNGGSFRMAWTSGADNYVEIGTLTASLVMPSTARNCGIFERDVFYSARQVLSIRNGSDTVVSGQRDFALRWSVCEHGTGVSPFISFVPLRGAAQFVLYAQTPPSGTRMVLRTLDLDSLVVVRP